MFILTLALLGLVILGVIGLAYMSLVASLARHRPDLFQ